MKKLLIILVSLIVVLFLALLLVPRLINWNGLIASNVKASTGRDLVIDGDVSLSIIPNLAFSATGVHLSNAPGAKNPQMVSVGEVSGKMRLLPLFGRRVVIDSFVIRDLSVHLEVDKDGRANWNFGTAEDKPAPAPGGDGLPITDLTLGDVKVSQGNISYIDATTGQTLQAKDMNLDIALANLSSPLNLALRMILNEKPLNIDLAIDAPRGILEGPSAMINATVDSTFITAGYRGGLQREPVPGLNGTFDLNIPSVGQLAAWLEQPLDPSQPDPGPLKVRAVFEGDGAKVALTEAKVEGSALKVIATGNYDGSGAIAKVALNVESDTLDIDRYLPPAAAEKKPAAPAKKKQDASGDIMAVFSQEPIDLSALRKTEADVRIAVRGIKALGFAIGQIDFTTTLKGGLLTADLKKLELYGGHVKGAVKLDGSGDLLDVDALIKINGVRVDQLARAATGGETTPVTGIASGNLRATAQGNSPRGLVESLKGGMAFDLGGVDIKDAPGGAISELKVALDLPGIERSPSLKSSVVYNKERVNLDLQLDAIKTVLGGEPFAVQAVVASKLLNANFDGTIQQQKPIPGLDGNLKLAVPSVARLMAWLDQPLDKRQPDPGPLKLRAAFESKGSQATLKEAAIDGKALKVKANGSVDNAGPIPVLTAVVRVEEADLNAYLPPPEKSETAAPAKTPKAPGKQEPEGWSEETLDLSALSQANADIQVDIDSLRYRDLTVKPGRIKVVLKNRVLQAAIEKLQVSDGTIASTVNLDASEKAASLDYQVAISGLEARSLLKTLAGNDRLSGKTEFQAKGGATGESQKELINALHGDGRFKFLDGAIHGINIPATLRKAKSLGFSKQAGEEVKTDFAELSGSFVIKDGVLTNRDLKLLAPLLRLSGGGVVPLPRRAVDYDITAKLVSSLKGQGGKDALAGVPIPIKVEGPWEAISYKVDWKKVFSSIAADPERLQNLPQNLREAGTNLGVDLPLPKLLDTEKATSPLKELPKLLDTEKATSPLRQLLPSTRQPSADPEAKPSTEAPVETKQPLLPDPSKALKGLFKK